MTRDEVELEIRRVLATETSAVRLSNALFTPGGLFSELAPTTAERLAVVDTPLFDEANRRLSELQLIEAGKLKKPVKPVVLPAVGTVHVEHLVPDSAP
ncbi:hypothetical protein [Gemmata sp.]|uniref:hypothetical protein n=1 Tax=Gemmata sp. TaxID=1914242 RepID=UPI003F708AE9